MSIHNSNVKIGVRLHDLQEETELHESALKHSLHRRLGSKRPRPITMINDFAGVDADIDSEAQSGSISPQSDGSHHTHKDDQVSSTLISQMMSSLYQLQNSMTHVAKISMYNHMHEMTGSARLNGQEVVDFHEILRYHPDLFPMSHVADISKLVSNGKLVSSSIVNLYLIIGRAKRLLKMLSKPSPRLSNHGFSFS